MGLYDKNALGLLCQQIMRDNPDLPYVLSGETIIVLEGPATNGLGTSGRNTRVVLNGRTGAGFVGKRDFFYDRINVGTLYNGLPDKLVLTVPNDVVTNADLLPTIKDALGITLTADDLVSPNTALGLGRSPTEVSLAINTSCLSFTGTLKFKWQRGYAGYYPDSGPGSKYMLMGTMDEGYFGVVSSTELVGGREIYQALLAGQGTQGAVSVTDALTWLKFALDGEIVYFPCQNLFTKVAWNDYYALGAVYDRDDSGSEFVTNEPVKQRKYVVLETGEGRQFFRVRLPKVSTTDPITPSRGDPTGEPARLFNKVHRQSYGTGTWDLLTVSDFDASTAHVWVNGRADVDGNVIYTSPNEGSVESVARTARTNGRVLLILTDGEDVTLPVEGISGRVVGKILPPLLNIDQTRDADMVVRLTDIQSTYQRTIQPPLMAHPVGNPVVKVTDIDFSSTVNGFTSYGLELAPPRNVGDLNFSSLVSPFGVRFESVAHVAVDLANCDGELNGFQ
ncbi:putative virion structural protein [Salmonella phage SPAsTU]|nr:putative virion structural protein [Salmonella phage SPAsTU]